MNGLVTPFPVRFAERIQNVEVDGSYSHATQTSEFRGDMASRTTTHVETGTGGHNDTDQEFDED